MKAPLSSVAQAYNGWVNSTQITRTTTLGGPAVALAVAAITASVRDQVGASNVGIALAIVVVGAALVSRWAGLATAAVAAIAFNFFHTQPYHSLRVHSPRDVMIVALLAVLGIVVSDISAWRRRRDTIAFRHSEATAAPKQLAALLVDQHPVSDVWPTVATSIMDQLMLASCRFEPSQSTSLPTISRVVGRSADGDDGFVLPSTGAALPVVSNNNVLGYLILTPNHGVPSLWVERRVVVALADHIAIALTYTGHMTLSAADTRVGHQPT
ncbi:MAG: DUF4118 domain-containing protein [Ilumatobacteraceae bacterium]